VAPCFRVPATPSRCCPPSRSRARLDLEKAVLWMNHNLPAGTDGKPRWVRLPLWGRGLELTLLRQEAEKLIGK